LAQRHRYAEVDALRGLAAVSVVIYHLVGHRVSVIFGAQEAPKSIFDPFNVDAVLSAIVTTIFNGAAAVTLFFAISGFVLAHSLRKAPIPTPANYLAFLIRRVLRLVPGVWLSLVLALGLQVLIPNGPPPDQRLDAFWLGDSINGLNAPLWTIRVELAMSAVFPLLLFLNWACPRWLQIVIALALIPMTSGRFGAIWIYAFTFQLGIMLPDFGRPMIAMIPRRLLPWVTVLALAIFLSSLNLLRLYPVVPASAWTVIKSIMAFYLLAYVVYGPPLAWLRARWLQFLGEVSYGIYLFHGPLMFVAVAVSMWIFAPSFTSQSVLFGSIMLIGVLPATVLLAWASYRYVEQPCIRWGRSLTEAMRRSDIAPPERAAA
jgi:peptidoglycan/LPS O-acetylase OafA/YrhL